MKTLTTFAAGILLALGICAKENIDMKKCHVEDFEVKYKIEASAARFSLEKNVEFSISSVDDPMRKKIIRGIADFYTIPLPFCRLGRKSIEMITYLDTHDKPIEFFLLTRQGYEKVLSEFDRTLIERENFMDKKEITSLDYMFIRDGFVFFPEKGDSIKDGEAFDILSAFLYFLKEPTSCEFPVYIKGDKYNILVNVNESDGELIADINLDIKKKDKEEELIKGIKGLKIHLDRNNFPYKIRAVTDYIVDPVARVVE